MRLRDINADNLVFYEGYFQGLCEARRINSWDIMYI